MQAVGTWPKVEIISMFGKNSYNTRQARGFPSGYVLEPGGLRTASLYCPPSPPTHTHTHTHIVDQIA